MIRSGIGIYSTNTVHLSETHLPQQKQPVQTPESRPKACVLVKNPGMLHELEAPLTFKACWFQPPKLAFDSFCNQISLTARMHKTNIIALDCDCSLQSHGTSSGGLKVCALVCVCVCVIFFPRCFTTGRTPLRCLCGAHVSPEGVAETGETTNPTKAWPNEY